MKSKVLPFLFIIILTLVLAPTISAAQSDDLPKTGFETRNDNGWTTHEEELLFLKEVTEKSDRMSYEQVATTTEGRPIHLVKIGYPVSPSVDIY